MAKIGVTGAGGYLGSKVCIELFEAGYEVVPVDNFSNNRVDSLPNMDIINADISSFKEIKETFSDVDVIVHLAASSSLESCTNNPDKAYKNNIIGTANIAWFCKSNSIPLLFASSVAVYGSPEKYPIRETTSRNPTNLYGKTKLIGENIIEKLSPAEFHTHIFNIGNICGSHEIGEKRVSRNNVVEIFISQALKDENLTVYKPGSQSRDFISIKDVSKAFLSSVNELSKSNERRCDRFLLSSGESTSVLDLAEKVSEEVAKEKDVDVEIELVNNPRTSEVITDDFEIDVKKIKNELGFEPQYTLNEIISESTKTIDK